MTLGEQVKATKRRVPAATLYPSHRYSFNVLLHCIKFPPSVEIFWCNSDPPGLPWQPATTPCTLLST